MFMKIGITLAALILSMVFTEELIVLSAQLTDAEY